MWIKTNLVSLIDHLDFVVSLQKKTYVGTKIIPFSIFMWNDLQWNSAIGNFIYRKIF